MVPHAESLDTLLAFDRSLRFECEIARMLGGTTTAVDAVACQGWSAHFDVQIQIVFRSAMKAAGFKEPATSRTTARV
jgi:hypothetical protein